MTAAAASGFRVRDGGKTNAGSTDATLNWVAARRRGHKTSDPRSQRYYAFFIAGALLLVSASAWTWTPTATASSSSSAMAVADEIQSNRINGHLDRIGRCVNAAEKELADWMPPGLH